MNIEMLIPVSLFFIFTALYFGALSVDVVGGTGPRQILSLLLLFVLYGALWFGLHKVIGGASSGFIIAVLIPTVLTLLALPLLARGAFMALGMRIQRHQSPAH